MTKLFQSEKSKSLTFCIKIFLACLICLLSILDAPEYVHCTHIGVCEFFEVCGNLKPSREAEKILTSIKKVINQTSSYFDAFFIEYYSHFPQRYSTDLTFSKIIFENVGLSVPFYIFSRYVYPDYKKILCFRFNKGHKILVKQEHIFSITNKFLPSQPLQIISTSIINS